MASRPTVPHESQLDWQADGTTVWEGSRAAELTPASWTEYGSDAGGFPKQVIQSSYALPSRIAELELGLAHGSLFYRSEGQYGHNLGSPTKHADQLDPELWPAVDEWVDAHARNYDGDAELVPVKVPIEWTGTTHGDDDGFPYSELRDGFMTVGELVLWRLLNPADPGDPGDPGDPEPAELPAAIVAFAGLPSSPELLALAGEHAQSVTLQIRGFTRGKGFDDEGEPADDIRAVIVSAAARSMANPTGMERMRLGITDYTPGTYAGWTLAELAILHNYRKRWA